MFVASFYGGFTDDDFLAPSAAALFKLGEKVIYKYTH